MKKIAVFPGVFLTGGVETVLMNILSHSDRNAYQFDFFVPRKIDEVLDLRVFEYGGRVIEIPQMKKIGSLMYIYKLTKILKKYGKYDIIHVHSIHSGVLSSIAGFFLRIPLRIYHVHNTEDPTLKNLKFKRLYRFIFRLMINTFNNRFVACGRDAAKYIYYKSKIINNKVIIFKNAVDLNKFKVEKPLTGQLAMYGIGEYDILIGNAARFTKVKNQEFLISLMSDLNSILDAYLLLAGDGEELEKCKSLAKKYEIDHKVVFLGNITNIPEFLNLIDVFVLPSLHEGLPVSILESQACGIPSIVSDSVTDEVDMQLGLVSFLPLNVAHKLWINEIIMCKNKRIWDQDIINMRFTQQGYNLDYIGIQISELYSDN